MTNWKGISILNIYTPNSGVPSFIKNIPPNLKGQINNRPLTMVISIAHFFLIDRFSRQKINRETSELNEITNQMDLANICRTSHPNTKEYNFCSAAEGSFSKI